LVVGALLLVGFALLETRASYPLLPPRVVLNRTRGGSMLAMLFASIGIFGVFLFLTYYLQGTLGFSPVKTGVAFLPMVIVLAGTAQVSNRVLLPLIGPKVIVPIGLLVDAAALYLLHLVGLHSSYVSHVLPYLLLLGLGFGLSLAPSFSTGTASSHMMLASDRRPSTPPSRSGARSARLFSTPWRQGPPLPTSWARPSIPRTSRPRPCTATPRRFCGRH
jgi:hypothetical protein